jgi:hypothetical protein
MKLPHNYNIVFLLWDVPRLFKACLLLQRDDHSGTIVVMAAVVWIGGFPLCTPVPHILPTKNCGEAILRRHMR